MSKNNSNKKKIKNQKKNSKGKIFGTKDKT